MTTTVSVFGLGYVGCVSAACLANEGFDIIGVDVNVAKVTLVEVPDRPGVAAAVFQPLADAGINVDMVVQNVGHHGATDLSFTLPRADLGKAKRLLDPIARGLGFREMTTDSAIAKVSIVGAGIQNAPGYAARMFSALADAGVNIEMISTSEIRITCLIAEDEVETATTDRVPQRHVEGSSCVGQPPSALSRPVRLSHSSTAEGGCSNWQRPESNPSSRLRPELFPREWLGEDPFPKPLARADPGGAGNPWIIVESSAGRQGTVAPSFRVLSTVRPGHRLQPRVTRQRPTAWKVRENLCGSPG